MERRSDTDGYTGESPAQQPSSSSSTEATQFRTHAVTLAGCRLIMLQLLRWHIVRDTAVR